MRSSDARGRRASRRDPSRVGIWEEGDEDSVDSSGLHVLIQVKLLRCLWRVCNKPMYAFFGNVSFFTSSFPSLSVYVNTLIADGMSDSSTKLGPSTLPLTALSLTHPSAFATPVTEPGAAYTTPSLCSTTTFSSPYTTISAFSYAIIHNSHRLPFSQSSFGFPHSRRAAKRLPRQRFCTRQPPCGPDR